MSLTPAQRRARQSIKNLIWALLATIGAVLIVIAIVPRDDSSRLQSVDAAEVAQAARDSSGLNVLELAGFPEGWYASRANWSETSEKGEAEFFIGLVGPDNQYLGVTQVLGFSDAWLAEQTKDLEKTDEYFSGENFWWVLEPAGTVGVEDKDKVWALFIDQDVVLVSGVAESDTVAIFLGQIDSQLTKESAK